PLNAIAGDAKLGATLAHPKHPRAIQSRLAALARLHKNVRQIVAYDLNRRKLASVGSPTAVAAAVATPSTTKGRRLGYVAVSITGANDYVREVARLTQLHARVATEGRILASTLDESGPAQARSGDVTIAGRKYRGRFTTLAQAAGPPVAVGVFEEGSSIAGAVRDRRLLIGAILVAFLLLALLSSVVVVRALQGQIEQFLQAARRLARGDFSEPVPVEGADEFAALGTEFNAMSGQLASKIDEVERKRGELEETI